ncbi:MAG: hypothetical protein ACRDSR_24225 [Pseudonocardiaceae bacterium]
MLAAAAEGIAELLAVLRLIDTEGIQLAEVKLVLVGEGAVGKSSLLAALRGEPWVEHRSQTHGLQILMGCRSRPSRWSTPARRSH